MKYKARFGRWAEGCVARAFRDRQWIVLTQPFENTRKTFDMEIQSKGEEGLRYLIQVKGVARSFGEGVRFHYKNIKRWLEEVEFYQQKEMVAGRVPLPAFFCVVCPEQEEIAIFPVSRLRIWCAELEESNGDHYSFPGTHVLEWDRASRHFDLARDEVLRGLSLARDEDVQGELDIPELPGI